MSAQEKSFKIHAAELVVTSVPWWDSCAEALVLSANNQLSLRRATGLALWVGKNCPSLHDECQRLVRMKEHQPWRGILPGDGLVTEDGPGGKIIIHAVTVDYGGHFLPGEGKCHAGIDTVAAATTFALTASIRRDLRSVAFAPMCTRGHARACLPDWMAGEILPRVQAEIIFGLVTARTKGMSLKRVVFSTYNEDTDVQALHFRTVKGAWTNLHQRFLNGTNRSNGT